MVQRLRPGRREARKPGSALIGSVVKESTVNRLYLDNSTSLASPTRGSLCVVSLANGKVCLRIAYISYAKTVSRLCLCYEVYCANDTWIDNKPRIDKLSAFIRVRWADRQHKRNALQSDKPYHHISKKQVPLYCDFSSFPTFQNIHCTSFTRPQKSLVRLAKHTGKAIQVCMFCKLLNS